MPGAQPRPERNASGGLSELLRNFFKDAAPRACRRSSASSAKCRRSSPACKGGDRRRDRGRMFKTEAKRYREASGVNSDWIDDREDFHKALAEARYRNERGVLVDTIESWWADVLRQQQRAAHLDLPDFSADTAALAGSPRRLRRDHPRRSHRRTARKFRPQCAGTARRRGRIHGGIRSMTALARPRSEQNVA